MAACVLSLTGLVAEAQDLPQAPSALPQAPSALPADPSEAPTQPVRRAPAAAADGLAAPIVADSGPVVLAKANLFGGAAAYESCTFADGLALVGRSVLNGGITERDAETSHGSVAVKLEAGERITFAYPGEDEFAELKLEKLPAANYRQQRQVLIEDFDHTLAQSPAASRNYTLPGHKRGFEIYGLDRGTLGGKVLGIYLFFDDLNRIVTTVEFLNADPGGRRFQTMAEYRKLRDGFLDGYTGCVRTAQGVPLTP